MKLFKLLLLLPLIILLLGAGILLIDRLFVRDESVDRNQQLADVARELSLELYLNYQDKEHLKALGGRFSNITKPATDVGTVMIRHAEDHELILYEHLYQAATQIRSNIANRHDVEVQLLGIVIYIADANWENFELFPNGHLIAINEEAARNAIPPKVFSRLQLWKDFSMGASGQYLYFIAKPPSSALMASSERSVSPEFHAGLLNSGLKIDVQRAIDIANMMNEDRQPLAAVYRIDNSDINVNLPTVNKVALKEMNIKIDQTKADLNEGLKQSGAKFQADLDTFSAKNKLLLEKFSAGQQAKKAEHQEKWDEYQTQKKEMDTEYKEALEHLRAEYQALRARHEVRRKEIMQNFKQRMESIQQGESNMNFTQITADFKKNLDNLRAERYTQSAKYNARQKEIRENHKRRLNSIRQDKTKLSSMLTAEPKVITNNDNSTSNAR